MHSKISVIIHATNLRFICTLMQIKKVIHISQDRLAVLVKMKMISELTEKRLIKLSLDTLEDKMHASTE